MLKSFRPPSLSEALENRQLLSGSSGAAGVSDVREVTGDFAAFVQAYSSDAANILFSTAGSRADARPSFDQTVADRLSQLRSQISADLSTRPAPVQQTIGGQLTGDDASSLQSRLAALPTPAGSSAGSMRSFLRQSNQAIFQTRAQILAEVREAPPISNAVMQADVAGVKSAFADFRQEYGTEFKSILLPGAPKQNRQAFDAAVAASLVTLNDNLTAATSDLPPAVQTSLSATIQSDLLTANEITPGASLESRLVALSTPPRTSWFSKFVFKITSGLITAAARSQVVSALAAAIRQFNATS